MSGPHVIRRLRPAAVDVGIAACGLALLARQFVHAAGSPGIDFVHVWHATHQLLATSAAYADPMFTYPPGSALLLAPLGILNYHDARLVMLVANVIAVVWATWLALSLVYPRPGRRTVAVALLALGVASAVASTWANVNLNGLLLWLEVAALYSMHRGRWVRAAALLGITLAIKPVLVALLVMFAVRRQWRALIVAVAVPIAVTGLGWWLVRDSSRYANVVVPFLLHGAQLTYNDSFVGVGHLLSLPGLLIILLRLGVLGAAVVWYVRRRRNHTDSSIVMLFGETGILLTATFLAAPMSEAYYTIYLIPAIAAWTSKDLRSVAGAAFTVAACFATFQLPGNVGHAPVSVPLALRPTLGWIICLATFAAFSGRGAPRRPLATAPSRLSSVEQASWEGPLERRQDGRDRGRRD